MRNKKIADGTTVAGSATAYHLEGYLMSSGTSVGCGSDNHFVATAHAVEKGISMRAKGPRVVTVVSANARLVSPVTSL